MVSWTVMDNESAVTSKTGCDPVTVSAETTGQILTCTATSSGGTASQSVTVKLDLNAPGLTCPANVTVTQGQTINLGSPTVTDTMDPAPVVTNNAPGSYPVGTTTVTWTATDAAGRTSTCAQTVTVNAAPVNRAPVANNDAFTLAHAGTTPVIVPTPGVLSNDTDADGNALSVVGATASTPRTIALNNSGGTVALYADGHFVYTPPSAKFNGSRSFTYQVTDGQAPSNTATVTLTIQVNTAPVASNDIATTAQGQAISINVLPNDTDAQSNIDPSSVAIGTPPTNGSTTLNANGTVVYTPAAGFAGTDTFTYTVKDSLGATSNAATVTVYVPGAVDDSYTATANNNATQTVSVSTANGVRANDPPTGAAGRTITLVSGPTRTSGTGTATMALTLNANGSFSLTLTAPASATTAAQRRDAKRGTYQFTYTMTLNGVTTAPATATITVQ
jgi:hypothetical protein